MYEIAICDDDPAFSARFQEMLAGVLDERGAAHRIALFPDPAGVMRSIESGARYDLLFQDVLFDVERGIRFARFLRERKWDLDIVFVTSAPEYAIEGYSAYPLNYLLKPVSREKLAEVMDRFLEKRTPRRVQFSTAKGQIHIQLADVLFFEVYDHEIVAHLADGGRMSFTGTLRELEDVLPGRSFVRCHRCYLVNLEYVRKVNCRQLLFPTGESVPVSKRIYAQVMNALNDCAARNSLLFRTGGK